MKLLLPLLCVALVSTIDAVPVEVQADPTHFYHEAIGIAAAERIRRAEEEAEVTNDVERIAGGLTADVGDFPYMGGLVITLTSSVISVCGSSLLSNTRAVTAAHCWWDGQNRAVQFIVVLGSTTLFSGGVRIFSNIVEMHANYNPINRANDIAIISITHVTYTAAISPISLPNGDMRDNDFAQWWGIAVGFGITSSEDIISPAQGLSHVSMRVILTTPCQTWFTQVHRVTESNICARSDASARGVCRGDSGGPLVYADGIRPVLIGIKSFDLPGSCSSNSPAAFVRVTTFNNWLRPRI